VNVVGKHWTSREKKLLLCVVILSVAVASLLFASRSSEQTGSTPEGIPPEGTEFPLYDEHQNESGAGMDADNEAGGGDGAGEGTEVEERTGTVETSQSGEDAGAEDAGAVEDTGAGASTTANTAGSDQEASAEQQTDEPAGQMMVDVKGAVHHPDVYVMQAGDRIKDALEKAGGVDEEATTDPLNLAQMVEDGMVIYVPTVEEVEEVERAGKSGEQGETGGATEEDKATEGETQWVRGGTGEYSTSKAGEATEANGDEAAGVEKNGSGAVNINEADETKLQTLSGIGPSRADAIIRHREENGLFQDVRDIMNVTGIGPAIFEQIEQEIEI
jgi:competence protein ComEA